MARSPPLSDAIEIRGLRVQGRHGALPGERDRPQPFVIDLVLEVDVARARRSDDLSDTIDYATVAADVRRIVEQTSFRLLERLGDEILAMLLRDERVISAEIAIAKPAKLDGATPVVRLRARSN